MMKGMMASLGLGTEIIYSFVIIVACLMIYFGTKELYNLTSHKGIKYFREAFLFFALAFFFRSFVKTFFLMGDPRTLKSILPTFGTISTFLFTYFITIAVFFLIYSMFWKKLEKYDSNKSKKHPPTIYFLHIISIAIALIVILTGNPWIALIINIALFLLIILSIYFLHKNKKEKNNSLGTIYTLLSLFLLLNIIDIIIPNALQLSQIFIYLVSSFIFLWILYKVLRKTGSS